MIISDALATQLLNVAPDPTVIVDGNGTIIYANARVPDVLGYTPEEIIGKPVEVLLPQSAREGHPKHRSSFFEKPRARSMGGALELYALRKDGTEIPVEVSLSPLETPDGILVTSAIRDLSAQKALAQQLAGANRAKSRFLAAASHDLRQPIQTLNMLNQAAKRKASEPVLVDIIEKQHKSLTRMSHLLNSLLDISKLEAGVIKPEITDGPISSIFDTVGTTFGPLAEHKGLALEIEANERSVKSDAKLLTQVLENFVSNAIRYTQQGMIKVHTALQGNFMRLMVTDTGIGIAPEDIDSIFDEFHQVKTNSFTEGLGLGLSIVQRTAELLNCRVGVQSELGHGSSFYIDVPLGNMENNTEHEDTATSSRPEGSGHVLIVDDEPDIIEATTMLLEIEGFSVSSAQSIPSLRGFIMGAPQPPDLLISDFHLRDGETGLEIIELAREAFGQQLPVILISGDTQNQALLKNQENVLFFTKPVDVEQLIDNAVRLISEK